MMLLIRGTDGLMWVIAHTDPVTRVLARTDLVLIGHMDRVISALVMAIQAPSRSRLAIDRTTLAALVITWVAPITPGGRDTGHGATVKESGFVATMC
jgi:hypothetical protein